MPANRFHLMNNDATYASIYQDVVGSKLSAKVAVTHPMMTGTI